MAICLSCGKHSISRSWSRHKKGSSGASEWPLRAQITKKSQSPNLHTFKNKSYCTKCLRIAKVAHKPTGPLKTPAPVTV